MQDAASRWWIRGALVAWIAATSALGGILLLRHEVPLPTPGVEDARLHDELAARLPGSDWRAFHVMYRSCPCSRRAIDHLVSDPRPDGLRELVFVVDDAGAAGSEDQRLRDAGFAVAVITPAELHDDLGLEAAPVFAVMNPRGELGYVGGYNRHKQSNAYEDVRIVADLRAEDAVSSLPVFGCPTSARLARIVDPLGLSTR